MKNPPEETKLKAFSGSRALSTCAAAALFSS